MLWWTVILIGYVLLRIFVQGKSFNKSTRCDGKVVIITGGSSGIGLETAVELAKRGAKVFIACRSLVKGEQARKKIVKQSGSEDVHLRKLDLASFDSIRAFVERFLEEHHELHILINNAAILANPYCKTRDGLEMQIGVNHFGHFLLTNLLLPTLKNSAPSRIVNVSSIAHRFGTINKNDLNSEKSYNLAYAYAQSKLANVLFTRELAKRLEGSKVTVNALHPGVINTNIMRHLLKGSDFLKYCIKLFLFLLLKTPKAGAQTTIFAALDPELNNVSGQYFSDCDFAKVSEHTMDDTTAKWLWDKSEKLTMS